MKFTMDDWQIGTLFVLLMWGMSLTVSLAVYMLRVDRLEMYLLYDLPHTLSTMIPVTNEVVISPRTDN